MTITKEGALASFYTVNKAPIKHLRVYFSPKQAGSGTVSPENVREISGWDSLRLFFTGKNMLNPSLASQYVNQKQVVQYGVVDWRTPIILDGSLILTPGTYIYGVTSDVNRVTEWAIRDESGVALDHAYSGHRQRIFTVTNTSKIRLYVSANHDIDPGWIYLYKDSTTTDYEKNKSNNQTITFPSTLYGGYVDLITGEIVEEYIKRQVTEFTGVLGECKNGYCAYVYDAAYDHTVSKLNPSYMKCNYFEYSPYGRGAAGGTSNGMPLYTYGGDNGGLGTHGFILPSTITSLAEANAWLNNLSTPLECIIRLKNPNTYTLTPQQLQTFLGRNNIWSNADRIEVEYDLAESNDELYRRRNILLQGAPHLETATSNIANFRTDLVAPIKETKVYFEPKQLGSGDPSPSNVREIVGFNNIDINRCRKNLLQLKEEDMVGLSWYRIFPFTIKAGTYTMSASGKLVIDGGNKGTIVNLLDKDDNEVQMINKNYDFCNGRTSFTFTLTEEEATQVAKIRFQPTASGLTFAGIMGAKLQIEQGTTTSSFEEYNGDIIPIKFPTVGKNLLDITQYTSKYSNIAINDNALECSDVNEGNAANIRFAQAFSPGTYTLSVKGEGEGYGGIRLLCDSEITNSTWNVYYNAYWIDITDWSQASGSLTFTLNQSSTLGIVFLTKYGNSGKPAKIYDIQLESGSTATTYEPYTNTIYGGYVDLTNGEIVQTHFLFQRRVSDMNNSDSYPGWRNCSDFKTIANYIDNTDNGYRYNLICNVGDRIWYNSKVTNPTVFIYLDMKNNMTQTEWKTNYPDLVMKWVLPLAVPIHYPLTPQTLKTLKGTNNIWSSANGPVSIKYWTH